VVHAHGQSFDVLVESTGKVVGAGFLKEAGLSPSALRRGAGRDGGRALVSSSDMSSLEAALGIDSP